MVRYISVKKIIENCNSVGAGAHNVGEIVFGPTLTLILLKFGELKKGKLHILKKLGLSTFKEILKTMYVIAESCFLTFCLKRYSETLS